MVVAYTGLVIALINSFNLFWIACTWAWVGGLEMVWLNTATLGFSAVAEIRLAVLVAFTSMMDLRPVNWFRNSDEEMSELFTGNVGSYGIVFLEKNFFDYGVRRQAKRDAAFDSSQKRRRALLAAALHNLCQGTTLVAGSLHGPGVLPAPIARTCTHNLAPLVRPSMVALDLLADCLKAHDVGVIGSGLV